MKSKSFKKLSHDWYLDGLVDFEYKKHLLLAYLQMVHKAFTANELYPHLSDLVAQYRSLKSFLREKEAFQGRFPKQMGEIDLQNFRIAYQKVMQDSDLMKEIEEIVRYSLTQIEPLMAEGSSIHDFIEQQIQIDHIGILPIHKDEGYMLLKAADSRIVDVYRYERAKIQVQQENFYGLRTLYLQSFIYSIGNTFEHIKAKLIKTYRNFPHPATYLFESALAFPIRQSFLPVAKRLLFKELSLK